MKLNTRKVAALFFALTQLLWILPHWSHEVKQCSCTENKMLFGTHNNKWCDFVLESVDRSDRISAYSKNVNLPVLGQGNLPSNRSQLLSSEERRRKRGKDI